MSEGGGGEGVLSCLYLMSGWVWEGCRILGDDGVKEEMHPCHVMEGGGKV